MAVPIPYREDFVTFPEAYLAPTKYLRFEQVENPGRKTSAWRVRSVGSGADLGVIRWYSPWRQYCFYPAAATIFNTDCLEAITDRIATCNRWQRNIRANLATAKAHKSSPTRTSCRNGKRKTRAPSSSGR